MREKIFIFNTDLLKVANKMVVGRYEDKPQILTTLGSSTASRGVSLLFLHCQIKRLFGNDFNLMILEDLLAQFKNLANFLVRTRSVIKQI